MPTRQHFLLVLSDDDAEVASSGVILVQRCGDHFHAAIKNGERVIQCGAPFDTEEEAMDAAKEFLAAAGHGDAGVGPYIRVGGGLPN